VNGKIKYTSARKR